MSTTTTPAAPALSTGREAATRRLARIRDALVLADSLLADAWTARDWESLGHSSWAEYCAAELPELRHVRVSREERTERITALGAAGLTTRAIVDAYGYSLGTVHRVLSQTERPEVVTATDGRRRAARTPRPAPAPAPAVTRADQLVAAVAATGTTGATTAELVRRLKLHHGIVSGGLSRLARQGRVVRAGHARDGYGVYLAGPA